MKEKSIARQKVDIFQNLLDKYKIDSFVLGNKKVKRMIIFSNEFSGIEK